MWTKKSLFGDEAWAYTVKVISQIREIQEINIFYGSVDPQHSEQLVILIKPRQLYTVMQIIYLNIKLKELFRGRTVYIWWYEMRRNAWAST